MILFISDNQCHIKWCEDYALKSYLYEDETYQYNRSCSTREYYLGKFNYMNHVKKLEINKLKDYRTGLDFDLKRLREYINKPFESPVNIDIISTTTVGVITDIILRHYICINLFKDTGCHEFWEIKLEKAEKKFSKLLKDIDKLILNMEVKCD